MGDEREGMNHVEQRVERDFVQRFAATRRGTKSAPVDIRFLVASIIEGVGGDGEVPDQPTLEKAAKTLANGYAGWPTPNRFIEVLKAVIGGTKPAKPTKPDNWRWAPRRGSKDPRPQGVSDIEWATAYDRQERAAVNFLKNDIAGQVLARAAWEEDWLPALADFVVEHGRLPDPNEERRCKALSAISRQNLDELAASELQAQQRLIERVQAGERVPKGVPGEVALSSGALRRLRATMVERWQGLVVQ